MAAPTKWTNSSIGKKIAKKGKTPAEALTKAAKAAGVKVETLRLALLGHQKLGEESAAALAKYAGASRASVKKSAPKKKATKKG